MRGIISRKKDLSYGENDFLYLMVGKFTFPHQTLGQIKPVAVMAGGLRNRFGNIFLIFCCLKYSVVIGL